MVFKVNSSFLFVIIKYVKCQYDYLLFFSFLIIFFVLDIMSLCWIPCVYLRELYMVFKWKHTVWNCCLACNRLNDDNILDTTKILSWIFESDEENTRRRKTIENFLTQIMDVLLHALTYVCMCACVCEERKTPLGNALSFILSQIICVYSKNHQDVINLSMKQKNENMSKKMK